MLSKNNILLLLSTVILSVACSQKGEDEGQVCLVLDDNLPQPVSVDLEFKSSSVTKAVTAEQLNAFTVWVEGTDISGTYGDIKSTTYKLKTGTYTAHAQNYTDEEAEAQNGGYGVPRYFGTEPFEILPLTLTKNALIQCKVANARVVTVLSDDFKAYFDESVTSVKISESSDFFVRPLPMLPSSGMIEAYISAGDDAYVEVTTTKIGADSQITYSIPVITDAKACTSYTVSLSVDETTATGGIKFIVSGTDILTNDFLSIQSYTPAADFTEDK